MKPGFVLLIFLSIVLNAPAQELSVGRVTLTSGNVMEGAFNMWPGKPIPEKDIKIQWGTKRNSSSFKCSPSLIDHFTIGDSTWYVKFEYTPGAASIYYPLQRLSGQDHRFYRFTDINGISSYFAERPGINYVKNVADTIFLSAKENKLFFHNMKCFSIDDLEEGKGTDYTITKEMTIQQRMELFRKWYREYDSCEKK